MSGERAAASQTQSQPQQQKAWRELTSNEQNLLVHRLLSPDWDKESSDPIPAYGSDANETLALIRWANQQMFRFDEFGQAYLACAKARVGLDPTRGSPGIAPEQFLLGLATDPADVAYALLSVYGADRPDIVVPPYGTIYRQDYVEEPPAFVSRFSERASERVSE